MEVFNNVLCYILVLTMCLNSKLLTAISYSKDLNGYKHSLFLPDSVTGDFVNGRFSKKFSGGQINKGKRVCIHQGHLIRQNETFQNGLPLKQWFEIEYIQTCVNNHLWTSTTCQQRPPWIPNPAKNTTKFYATLFLTATFFVPRVVLYSG